MLDGTETGTEIVDVTGGNSAICRTLSWARTEGDGWDLASTYGAQNTADNDWSVTSAASIDVQAGDVIVVLIAKNSDGDLVHASHALTATGITFGSYTSRASPAGGTSNDDIGMEVGEFPVTAGSGTVTLNFSVAMSGTAVTTAGVVVFVRLREANVATAPTLSSLIITPGTTTAGLSWTAT